MIILTNEKGESVSLSPYGIKFHISSVFTNGDLIELNETKKLASLKIPHLRIMFNLQGDIYCGFIKGVNDRDIAELKKALFITEKQTLIEIPVCKNSVGSSPSEVLINGRPFMKNEDLELLKDDTACFVFYEKPAFQILKEGKDRPFLDLCRDLEKHIPLSVRQGIVWPDLWTPPTPKRIFNAGKRPSTKSC